MIFFCYFFGYFFCFGVYKITQPNINDGDIRSEDITMKFKKMKIDYCLRMNKYFHIK
jgi:hypothetical protein